jgi:hypothetical protein
MTLAATNAIRLVAADGGRIAVGTNGLIDSATGIRIAMAGSGQLAAGGALTIDSGGDIQLTHSGSTGQPTVSGAQGLGLFAATDIVGDAGTRLNGTQDVTLGASGLIRIPNSTAGASLFVAATTVELGDAVAVADLIVNAAGNVTVTGEARSGGFTNVAATGAIVIDRVNSSGAATLDAGTGVTLGRIVTGGDATITARGGNVTINQSAATPLANSIGGNLSIRGTGIAFQPITVAGNALLDAVTGLAGRISVGGTTRLDADDGDIDMTLASGGAVTASANRITLNGLNNQALTIAQLTTDVGGAAVYVTGDLAIESATLAGTSGFGSDGGSVALDRITAAGILNVDAARDITLGQIAASSRLSATAGGRIAVNNVVSAAQINFASGDIGIAVPGRVGVQGVTTTISLSNNNSAAPAFVGGTGTRSGWHLDGDEITRIAGGSIDIGSNRVAGTAGTPRTPDVVVDAFTVNMAQQLGNIGTFRIGTPGTLRVQGNVRFTGATADQSVVLRGLDGLEVILGSGSVHVVGAAPDQLAGTLTLEARDIVVATAAAITDIAALTDLAAISARLSQNDGITSDIGALAANRMILDHRQRTSVYVQNSGTGTAFDQRRGLTVGAGGLFITGPGSGDRIVINGVQQAAGGTVTGLALIPLISINGSVTAPTGFDPRSTVNGCALGNVAACSATRPPSGEPESSFPVQDVIEEEVEGEGDDSGTGDDSITAPLITLRGVDPLTGQPLVDDPVTGAGNEDLWTPTD